MATLPPHDSGDTTTISLNAEWRRFIVGAITQYLNVHFDDTGMDSNPDYFVAMLEDFYDD